jgi:electron transport complex protein RnfD
MALLRLTSPHAHGPMSTQRVMQNVLLATVPGIIVLTHFFGYGTLVNILWGSVVALGCEALALKLRRRPLGFYLKDCSALVTAFLLCIALPPYSPWWLIAIGIASAILLAKHLYGGLGYNPFNPAMVGYVILLISFPVQMTSWAPPRGLGDMPGLLDALQACFTPALYDGVTGPAEPEHREQQPVDRRALATESPIRPLCWRRLGVGQCGLSGRRAVAAVPAHLHLACAGCDAGQPEPAGRTVL